MGLWMAEQFLHNSHLNLEALPNTVSFNQIKNLLPGMIISQPHRDILLFLLLCGERERKKKLYVTLCLIFQKLNKRGGFVCTEG